MDVVAARPLILITTNFSLCVRDYHDHYGKFTGVDGQYYYTHVLLALGKPAQSTTMADHWISGLSTPLHLLAWRRRLGTHPDKDYVNYILSGIEYGFRIGVDDTRVFKSAGQKYAFSKTEPAGD